MEVLKNDKLLKRYLDKHDMKSHFTDMPIECMVMHKYEKGEHICIEGQELEFFYLFVEGRAKVYMTPSNGRALLLSFYEGFRLLGDVELVTKKPASSNVQVIETAICIGIPFNYARKELIKDIKFLQYVCDVLGEKLYRSSINSSINLLYPLENRLASCIVGMIQVKGEVLIFQEKLTEIADLLGTSYRHLLRTLNQLTEKGVLFKLHKGYKVLDRNKLEILASDLYR